MHFRDDFLKKNYSDEVYCGIGHFYKKKILLGGDDEMQGGRTWQPFVGGKNGHENFVKRVFTIFVTNASFLHIIANLQI